ncbi:hypothetical protein TRFO_12086 [Tritrichomonas foetus]|uniref:Uncharacterized protein n=1 Tax=Tritrichomonas foetus TaxID=1144522 RepID=A0A1J4J5Y9_9EUKA|nr:hypothetical protein TRFO_12086 [Tritrichomonas foetus]|eukprot:OHS93067.1 hypothetical protein TRFO_12086 [Tritrichomonas foetus]
MDRGADPNQKNSKGATPLLVATTYKNIEAVKILLEHGADPNITNDIFLMYL